MNTDKSVRGQLHETALKAPQSSGVYLWRNEDGTVLYVGKAKNLKNRLSSYFSGRKDIKTRILISRAHSIEYIVTQNEYEALILENNLIKKYSPHFNIELKDGKSYPMLRITNEKFPRLFKTRSMVKDGSAYYGPFPDVSALETFLENISIKYKLRRCKKFVKKETPCLYYHMGQCSAPCCGKISSESYMELIDEIKRLLEENPEENLKKLEDEMKEAAKLLQFEKAARIRDGINAVKILHMKNTVSDFDPDSRDYIGYATEGSLISFAVLRMRNGKLESRDIYRTFSLKEDDEVMTEFFPAYYTEKENCPAFIFVPPKTDTVLIRRWFKEQLKVRPSIKVVRSSRAAADALPAKHKAAFEMAVQNAKEDIIRRVRERGDIPAMQELQEILSLPSLPVRIEGFDIAHIGGKLPVASLISFYNGNPDKKNYRFFRLRTTDGKIDDFASMREASSRRYSRLLREGSEMPDLIMIDGGIGQVNAVQSVLDELNLDIPIVGLAKEDEELYLPGSSTPICLPKRSDALRLLQRVRDETHRFATSRNQALRTKANVVSRFESLPHIGKKRAKLIINKYRTLETFEMKCREFPDEVAELLSVPVAQVTEAGSAAAKLLADGGTKVHINKRYTAVDEYIEANKGAAGSHAPHTDEARATNATGTLDGTTGGLLAAEDEPVYGAE